MSGVLPPLAATAAGAVLPANAAWGDVPTTRVPHHHRDLLVFSNMSYLLIAFVALYRWHARSLTAITALEITVLVLFVTFFSSFTYHSCRVNMAEDSGTAAITSNDGSPNEFPFNTPCQPRGLAYVKTTFNESFHQDQVWAVYTALVLALRVIPLNPDLDRLYRTLALLSVTMLLLVTWEYGWIALIIVMVPALLLLIAFIWQSRNTPAFHWKWRALVVGFALMVGAWSLSSVGTGDWYTVFHSLWHILGGLAGALLLAGGVSELPSPLNPHLPPWHNIWKTHFT